MNPVCFERVDPGDAVGSWSFEVAAGAGLVVASGGRGPELLAELLLGRRAPVSGRVTVLGVTPTDLGASALRALRTRCGVVSDHGALLSNQDVWDNVALPLRYHGAVTEDEVVRRVDEALLTHGLAGVARRRPAELTRAERRLAALVRVDVSRSEVVLVQEPFEGLEEDAAGRVRGLLAGWVAEGRAVVVATRGAPSDNARLRLLSASPRWATA